MPRSRHNLGRAAPSRAGPDSHDLYDYARAESPSARPRSSAGRGLGPPPMVVTDDWPTPVPVTEAELAVFETHFTALLDRLFGT